MKRVIRVGSRDSKLAVAQTMTVIDEIKEKHPDISFELITMKTTGDKILDRNLDQIGGKGLFVKELDRSLLEGKVDITIHSLKDLPMEISPELPLLGFSKREDPRDVLILPEGKVMPEDGRISGCIGTSSRRRQLQLERLYPEATFRGIRGNVQTRLRKLEEEGYAATVLAMAGLKRLGMEQIATVIFSPEEIIPAAGQGILAVQGRRGEDYSYLEGVLDEESYDMATAERSFVTALDGGCSSPIAAHAVIEGSLLRLRGLYFDENSGEYTTGEKSGRRKEAEQIGRALAVELKGQ